MKELKYHAILYVTVEDDYVFDEAEAWEKLYMLTDSNVGINEISVELQEH